MKEVLSLFFFIKDGDNIITNKLTIANKFNSFFTNVEANLSNESQ